MVQISWKNISELPLDDEMYKKVLILVEGRLNSGMLYVLTDYWKVHHDEVEYTLNEDNGIRKKLDDGSWAYGSFSRGIKFDKVKGWMFEKDMVDLYNEEQEKKNGL